MDLASSRSPVGSRGQYMVGKHRARTGAAGRGRDAPLTQHRTLVTACVPASSRRDTARSRDADGRSGPSRVRVKDSPGQLRAVGKRANAEPASDAAKEANPRSTSRGA